MPQNRAFCLAEPVCIEHALAEQTHWEASADAATAAIEGDPGAYDAALVFDTAQDLAYTIRMNHTALPHTEDYFSDVSIGNVKVTREPDPDWKKYYFFSNLQTAVEQALMAVHLHGDDAAHPLDVHVRVRCSPISSAVLLALLPCHLYTVTRQERPCGANPMRCVSTSQYACPDAPDTQPALSGTTRSQCRG